MESITLETVINSAFEYHIQSIYTAIPGIVIKVHGKLEEQRVDVQPAIKRKFKDGSIVEQPVILNVPLQFPASSTSALTFPVNVGDTVMCIFSQRTLDTFKTSDGLCEPNDYRKFDRRDAMAIPGIFPFTKAINNPKRRTNKHSTEDMVLAHNIGTANECEVRLKKDGNIIINTEKNVTVNCTEATVNGNAKVNGTTDISGDVKIGGKLDVTGIVKAADFKAEEFTFLTHTHTGNLGSPTSPPTS